MQRDRKDTRGLVAIVVLALRDSCACQNSRLIRVIRCEPYRDVIGASASTHNIPSRRIHKVRRGLTGGANDRESVTV
jgi:hypothetical protein